MLIENLINEVRTSGFGIYQALLSNQEVLTYSTVLNELIELQADGGLPFADKGLIHSPMFIRREFMGLLDSETLLSVVDGVLDKTAILYAFSTSTVSPNDSNYAGGIHVDSPRIIPGYITNLGFVIALTDFNPENGATQILPSSFEREEVPTGIEFDRNAVTVSMKAGDALVFNCRCWHRSTRNQTFANRKSITLNFCRSFMRQRFDYPKMISDLLAKELSQRQRRFLGFDVQMPTSFEEFSAPPELRKYKPNQG